MQYEPLKHKIDKLVSRNPLIRRIFFRLLNLHLLRTWHVHREIRNLREVKITSVLDAGAGFGQYSWFISKIFGHDAKIKGIDLSPEHVRKANLFFRKSGKSNIVFEAANLESFVEKDAFDFIVCIDVMEHIPDDEAVFSNFCKSLKSGGLLMVTTPSDQGGSDVHEEHGSSFIEEHVRDGYSHEDITEKLKKAGFSRVEIKYTYGKPGQLSWKLSMKNPLKMIAASKLLIVFVPFYLILVYPLCLILNFLDVRGNHKSGTGILVKAWK